MSKSNSNKHLTLEERIIIETGIKNGSTMSAIAITLGKDKSTICKERSQHLVQVGKCNLPLECANYKKCKPSQSGKVCKASCPDYVPFKCKRRDRTPGACNGCDNFRSCHYNKYKYSATQAQAEYEASLVNTRIGVNASVNQIKELGELIEPLIKKGHSVYTILKNHPDIKLSEKTIYNYIENRIFKDAGVNLGSMDLRCQVHRKITKRASAAYKPRNDRLYLNGRLYKDFLAYLALNPDARIVEMDTVYNDVSNGPFMQTFKFLHYGFMILILHPTKTAEEMYQGILMLEQILGEEMFSKEVEVLITDRGSEFMLAEKTEKRSDGTMRTRVFYCDPMQAGQKGSLENNHLEIRYICPKETDLYNLGLKDQNDANLISSHINSFPKEKLDGKTPFQLLEFLNPTMARKLKNFGIVKIPSDKVILKPYLLKK